MRRCHVRLALTALLVLCFSAPARASDDIAGTWEGNLTTDRGEHLVTELRLVQDGAAVGGELALGGSSAPVCNGTFDGQILRFEIDRNWQAGQTCATLDPASTVRFEARVKGPTISGTFGGGGRQGSAFWVQVDEAPPAATLTQPTPSSAAAQPSPDGLTEPPGATPAAVQPTVAATAPPPEAPTLPPTVPPTMLPADVPTVPPLLTPTDLPAVAPTEAPTQAPAVAATEMPTEAPTMAPTVAPTEAPKQVPTVAATEVPTEAPTMAPTVAPTLAPTVAPTVAAVVPPAATTGGASPYETTRAYIDTVRGEDPAAFVALWNSADRQSGGAVLEQIFGKARPKLRQIADALETQLRSDAFRLQDQHAILNYPCTSRTGQAQQCVFTLTQEADGRWYIEDLD